MDIWLSQSSSSAFLEAYRRCMNDAQSGNVQHFMAFPAIVCAAFSIEVGLKTILQHEGTKAHGHDLLALFLKVSDARKIEIIDHSGETMEYFVAHLKHSKNAFVDWRYIYEASGEKHINVAFMGKLASAVEAVCLRMKNAA